jgi:hypothetical protein
MSGPFAFVTLLSSNSYLPGALVLAAGLKDIHPSPPQHPEVDFKTVCLVTPETVDVKSIKALRKAFDIVIGVELIEAPSSPGLQLLGEPNLSSFFLLQSPLGIGASLPSAILCTIMWLHEFQIIWCPADGGVSPRLSWDSVLHAWFSSPVTHSNLANE